jgi:Fe-S-cluster containining protein
MNPAQAQAFVEENLWVVIEKSRRAGRPVTCRGKGCSACCSEPVYLSEAEARYIVESLTDEQKREVAARASEWLVKVQRLLNVEEPHVLDWLALRAPCPLLKDGLCMVYDKRPVSCRIHLAIGDPDDCATLEGRKHQKYCQSPEFAKMALQAEVDNEAGVILFDNLGVWLVEMLTGMKVNAATRSGLDVTITEES